ncbi:MAG: DUF3604 domain-containing protein [Gammaproteobacteria bacterium]|nr:DUF3604 domain-containing protein [Gammaproteobacteria bacterium]
MPTIYRLLPIALLYCVSSYAVADGPTENPLRNLYFGETHVHTAYSLDAFLGGTRQTPSDAYRAAKGETVVVNGQPHRMRRPLDFAAVTDHVEYLGEMYAAFNPGSPGHDNPILQQLLALTDPEERRRWFMKYVISNSRSATPKRTEFFPGEDVVRSGWKSVIAAAEQHYQPGVFSTLIAFEWTFVLNGGNLHRNILFRDSTVPELPLSRYELRTEEQLWGWLEQQEKAGVKAIAIPHNSNASKGMMFAETNSAGAPIDKAYARLRAHFERAIEVMQIKGNSEVHRNFWRADEFSDYENADSIGKFSGRVPAKENYVRYGVVKGLAHEQTLGVNPYKLGFVGGTDSHNGIMGDTDEDNFVGGHGLEDASAKRRQTSEVGGWIASREQTPGSLTGAWATSNTREAIWDAIYNRETFATSGSRIAVRLFGGWNYAADLHTRPDRLAQAYRHGVPMGADMKPAGKRDGAPRFIVMASKDALGANLDRIQIIKGWVDAQGSTHDKVFDVVWSGERRPGNDGKLPAVGNTVDLRTASYQNSIGEAQLATVWQDPEFDPSVQALYYARVIEIPTPRWTTYDSVRAGLPLLDNVPATIAERAWSSPIWYTP